MAKTKVTLTDYEKIKKEFDSDFNDNELQERFERFEKNVKHFKGLYNELVPKVNEDISKQALLRHMIVESAKQGFLNTDAANQINVLDKRLDENIQTLDNFKSKFDFRFGIRCSFEYEK
jgi:flagellar capping protein FliD